MIKKGIFEPCYKKVFTVFVGDPEVQHQIGPDVWHFYLKLPIVPYIVCANSEGSGETAQICWLAGAFVDLMS